MCKGQETAWRLVQLEIQCRRVFACEEVCERVRDVRHFTLHTLTEPLVPTRPV